MSVASLAPPAEDEDPDPLRGSVNARKVQLRVERQAAAELAAESAPAVPLAFRGVQFLAQPDEEPVYRIGELWPLGGNVVLAAQYKSGKTTMVHNLLRSLCDGTAFLGRFHVTAPPGGVFMLDTEMPPNAARRWLIGQGIGDPDRFTYQNLRGAAASFNLLLPDTRLAWAARIAASGASTLILDCLGPILSSLGMDENSVLDVGRFLAAFDQLLAESGVTESVIVHHMGHSGERARGASRLRDWPDSEWRLMRQDEDPSSPRYLSAFGRDVDVAECRLEFDAASRWLRIDGGSRKESQARGAVTDLIEAVRTAPGLSGRQLETLLKGTHPRDSVRAGLRAALTARLLISRKGDRNADLHYLGPAATDEIPAMDIAPGRTT